MDRSDAIKLASAAGIPPEQRPPLFAALARATRSSADYAVRAASCTYLPGSGLDPDDGPGIAVRRLLGNLAAREEAVFGPVVVREQPTTQGSQAWVARCITVPVEVVRAVGLSGTASAVLVTP